MPARRPAVAKEMTPSDALRKFIGVALREQKAAAEALSPDVVHDLRVALRRCRTLAEGYNTLDDHRGWRRMHKSAKRLQDRLAGLRDAHVTAGRVRRLHLRGGAAGEMLAAALREEERTARREAMRALEEFPRKRWKRWRRQLPKRARNVDGAPAWFARLVQERLQEVMTRERRWRHTGSQAAAHSLRIAVKHFRYTLQAFLPVQYAEWGTRLKRMQDALGDMHDLDVLRGKIRAVASEHALEHGAVLKWLERIAKARQEAVERYRRAERGVGSSAAAGRHPVVVWESWRGEIAELARASSPDHATTSG